jgi:hypothetical protein
MHIFIIVSEISSRLTYVCDWIFVQQLGVDYKFCTNKTEEQEALLTIDYTNKVSDFSVPNIGLLFANSIEQQSIHTGLWNELPTLFAAQDADHVLPFDLFSAVFYLISRYEEYVPFVPDRHHRYPATESILFKAGLLERPIIDEWLFALSKLLRDKGLSIHQKSFEFLPTYDIDIAWSFKHKGLKRTMGGYLRDIAKNNFESLKERTAVLQAKKKDPYFSFDVTDRLHRDNELEPLYFILAAAQNTAWDKHILPSNKHMSALIQSLAQQYKIGIHPSYHANAQPHLFREEQKTLSTISGQQMDISRQHYIKVELPKTYRALLEMDIRQDYSMGYSTHLGFRAGTSRSFFWYDLLAEAPTQLHIFPFCFMDTTAHYEMGLSVEEAFEKLHYFKNSLQKINGLMLTVFHNFSLGTDKEWIGWTEAYADFIKK